MSSDDQNEVAEVEGPLVFQCAKCDMIIGDSFSYLCAREDLQTLTLTSSSNIARSAEVFTSYEGGDVGSTYFVFTCTRCEQKIGKYYITTSKGLDEIREKFTFSLDAISSYSLGKSRFGVLPEILTSEKSERVEGGENETSAAIICQLEQVELHTFSKAILLNIHFVLTYSIFRSSMSFLV